MPVKQKSAATAAQFPEFPQKNIWVLLRKTKEKTALSRRDSDFSSVLVPLYDEARTYFISKSWKIETRAATPFLRQSAEAYRGHSSFNIHIVGGDLDEAQEFARYLIAECATTLSSYRTSFDADS